MELYQRESLDVIRQTGARLSILSDRALVELWGIYSCETTSQFWVPCDSDEVQRFVAWAHNRRSVLDAIFEAEQARPPHKDNQTPRHRTPSTKRYVRLWGQRIPDPRVRTNPPRPTVGVRAVPTAPASLISVHELIRSINEWCVAEGVVPSSPGCSALINERMIRIFCSQGLLDPPGSPSDGRRRGFSERHACQLRAIRLLQARSLSLRDINGYLYGKSLEQLREIEREELALLKGTYLPGVQHAPPRRSGAPSWA